MDVVTRVEIMRSGHIGRWVAVAGALLVTGACAPANGASSVAAPSTPPSSSSPGGSPDATPVPSPEQQAAEQPPKGDDPVRVPPPKLSKFTYTFPVRGCSTTYQRRLLTLPKTTIWAAKGCAFVAPVGGVVDEVNIKNRWKPSTDVGADREGRFVTILGDDGVRYLGGHLDSVADGIRPGVRVKAGRLLGRVGNSGNARDTAPNLYFAISWKAGPSFWWVRRGMVEPWDYLDAWLSGNRTFSPKEETLALRAKVGETPRCSVQCSSRTAPQPSRTPRRPSRPSSPEPTVSSDPTATSWGQ